MFSYQRGALPGSPANAATSARGRAISIQVVTSTGIRRPYLLELLGRRRGP
jgi:hypothetical protein